MEVYGLNELQAALEKWLRELVVSSDLVVKLDCSVDRLVVIRRLLCPSAYGLLDGELFGWREGGYL